MSTYKNLTEAAVAVLRRHIVPDGISDSHALSELYAIFDGLEYRAAVAADAAETKALRDKLAGKALPGVLAAIMPQECHRWTSYDFAHEAYALADAMLVVRAK